MIAALIEKAVQHRWLVLILVAIAAGFGIYAFRQLPIDAYPDISAQAVFVTTPYPGRAPEEVERQVTIPVEIAMRNVPRAEVVRSRTIFGLSVVEVVFEEGTENYWARQRVQEKLSGLELPEGVHPDLGPLVSSCGEIYRYELVSDGTCDIMELRTLNDWVVIPRLLRVPGVADVTNFGGLAQAVCRHLPSGPTGALRPDARRPDRRDQEQQRLRRRQHADPRQHVAGDPKHRLAGEHPPVREHLRQVGRRHAHLPQGRGHRGPRTP